MQPWDIIVIALSAVAIHRLWLHEDFFHWPRTWCAKLPSPLDKPFLCPPCFAFWASILGCLLRWMDHTTLAVSPIGTTDVLATYPLVRGYMALPSVLARRKASGDRGNMDPVLRERALAALENRKRVRDDGREEEHQSTGETTVRLPTIPAKTQGQGCLEQTGVGLGWLA